ncbi:MAG: hypothetical protein SPJ78_03120 [Corynebacterium camporealensis]|uniref:hypothetical protein n=1 Tax=Corynebacterium camporealensis TaxID=161896 RepID=UPI002A91AC3A|nr:hypothetical protein [Corynebacterium camporealensis]MDY5839705.1 hypothetical protein [Corynebacterium camporealensis]
MVMKHAERRGLLGLFLAFAVACLCVVPVGNSPAANAQETGSLRITKEAGKGFNPAVDTAYFQARQLIGLKETDIEKLGELSQRRPELLTAEPGYELELGPEHEAATNATGVALINGLPAGAYQVTEVAKHRGNYSSEESAPFLMYVTAGAVTEVKAKPQALSVSKEALIDAARPGDQVPFKVSANVPRVDVDGRLHQYIFFDGLEPRLAFEAIRNAVIRNAAGEIRLDPNTDFQVSQVGNTVVMSLTQAGLDKLAAARAGHPETMVEFDLLTRLRPDATGSAPLRNAINFAPDGYCIPDQDIADAAYTRDELSCTEAHSPEHSEAVTVLVLPEDSDGGSSKGDPWWVIVLGALGLGALVGSSDGSSDGSSGSSEPGAEGEVPGDGSTTPGQPGSTEDGQVPGEAGETSHSDGSDAQSTPAQLARTGAAVIGIVVIGLLAVLLGIWLMRRKTDEDEEEVDAADAK